MVLQVTLPPRGSLRGERPRVRHRARARTCHRSSPAARAADAPRARTVQGSTAVERMGRWYWAGLLPLATVDAYGLGSRPSGAASQAAPLIVRAPTTENPVALTFDDG